MIVKILSGNQAGEIQDLPQVEAEVAISTGFAAAVAETSASAPSNEEAKGEVASETSPAPPAAATETPATETTTAPAATDVAQV
jgi:hypothetical protein